MCATEKLQKQVKDTNLNAIKNILIFTLPKLNKKSLICVRSVLQNCNTSVYEKTKEIKAMADLIDSEIIAEWLESEAEE